MGGGAKKRLDQLLVARGLCHSRARAQALIVAGAVRVDGTIQIKPGVRIDHNAELALCQDDHPWASRGGLKLVAGLDYFGVDPWGCVCLDVGASTGGFTDVLLHRGAHQVFAVDVGRGQLVGRLRQDSRVIVMEQTNARTLCAEDFPNAVLPKLDLVVCDASFISLKLVLPRALELVAGGGGLLALIKPQFEVGPQAVGKGGIVRDPRLHHRCCDDLCDWLSDEQGWSVQGICASPISGADGNQEFLIFACKPV